MTRLSLGVARRRLDDLPWISAVLSANLPKIKAYGSSTFPLASVNAEFRQERANWGMRTLAEGIVSSAGVVKSGSALPHHLFHTRFTRFGWASSPISAFRRPAISMAAPPGLAGSPENGDCFDQVPDRLRGFAFPPAHAFPECAFETDNFCLYRFFENCRMERDCIRAGGSF